MGTGGGGCRGRKSYLTTVVPATTKLTDSFLTNLCWLFRLHILPTWLHIQASTAGRDDEVLPERLVHTRLALAESE